MFTTRHLLAFACIGICVGASHHDKSDRIASAQSPGSTPTPTPKRSPTKPGHVGDASGGARAMVNLEGTWLLDKTKSENLTQRMQVADKVIWIITQDSQTISIDQD